MFHWSLGKRKEEGISNIEQGISNVKGGEGRKTEDRWQRADGCRDAIYRVHKIEGR